MTASEPFHRSICLYRKLSRIWAQHRCLCRSRHRCRPWRGPPSLCHMVYLPSENVSETST